MVTQKTNKQSGQSLIIDDNLIIENVISRLDISIFQQDVNLRFTKVFNPPEELKEDTFIGLSDHDVLPSEEALKITEIKEDVLCTHNPYEGNMELIFDGRKKNYNLKIDPVQNDCGEIDGVTTICMNLSGQFMSKELTDDSAISYKELFASMKDGVAIYDVVNSGKDFILADLNPAGEMISDLKLENIRGQNVLDVFPGVKDMGLLEIFTNVWKTGISGYLPLTLYKDARVFKWIENYIYKLSDQKIVAFFKDITSEKKTEEDLMRFAITYSKLFETITDAILIFEYENGKIIDANKSSENLYGYSRKELLQLTIYDIMNEPEKTKKIINDSKVKDIHFIPLNYHQKKDGTVIPVEVSFTCFKLRDREIHCGISRDISERLEADKVIRENEERLSLVLHGAQLGFWDQDFTKDTVIRNDHWFQMLGYTSDEIGSDILALENIIHPDDLSAFKEAAKWHEEGKSESFEVEHRLRAKNGDWVWVHNCGSIVERDDEGKPLRALGIHRDISKRKKTEIDLQESEIKLLEAQKVSRIGYYAYDIKKNIWSTSDELNRIFGIDDNYIKDIDGWIKIVHPEYKEKMLKYLQDDVIKMHQKFDMEYKILEYNSNQEKWVHGLGHLKFDKNGEAIEMFGTIQDITEQKILREKIRISEENFRNIITHTNQVFYLHDTDHLLTYVSPQCEDIFGYTQVEMIVKWTTLTTDNPINNFAFEMTERAIKTGKKQKPYLLESKRKDGRIITVEVNESPVKDDSGKVIGITGILRDVTEELKAEEAILASEAKFKALFEAVPDVVTVSLLTDDNQLSKYVEVNDVACNKLGYTREEFLKLKPSDIRYPKSSFIPSVILDELLKHNHALFESTVKSKDGKKIPLEINAHLFNYQGQRSILAIGRDITKRIENEERLKNQLAELDYLYSSSPVGLALVDKNLRYLRINETLARLNNLSPEDHIGKALVELLPSNLSEKAVTNVKEVFKNHKALEGIELRDSAPGDEDNVRDWLISYYPVESPSHILLGVGVVVQDITEIKKARYELEILNSELIQERKELENKNITLRELMHQFKDEKLEIAVNMQANVDKAILPMFRRLEKLLDKKEQQYLINIQKQLEGLISPYLNKLTSVYSNLSPRDIEICNLIKNGHTSKEISEYLNVSEEAIRSRRKIIRKKIGIDGENVNLATFLQSLS